MISFHPRCCSTILPTLTTLFGFLMVTLASRRSPNYPSLTLTLDQNNPDITVDRNPIMFNNPGVYDCQPGQCMYSDSTVNTSETSELYYFCGVNAKVGGGNNNTNTVPTCTIKDSSSIIDQISQSGAFGVGSDVSDVSNVSHNSFDRCRANASLTLFSPSRSLPRAFTNHRTNMVLLFMAVYFLLTTKTASCRLEAHLMIQWQNFARQIQAIIQRWINVLTWRG